MVINKAPGDVFRDIGQSSILPHKAIGGLNALYCMSDVLLSKFCSLVLKLVHNECGHFGVTKTY